MIKGYGRRADFYDLAACLPNDRQCLTRLVGEITIANRPGNNKSWHIAKLVFSYPVPDLLSESDHPTGC